MNLEHPVEILDADLVHQEAPAADAGVVDQDVDGAERLGRVPDAGLQGGDVADIHFQLVRPAAALADRRSGLLDPVDDVVDDQIGAPLGEKEGMTPPHPAPRAGDQRYSSFERTIRHKAFSLLKFRRSRPRHSARSPGRS